MINIIGKKALVIGIILIFVGASVITPNAYNINEKQMSFKNIISTSEFFPRGILYVGGTGPGNYTNIQDALDNANEGDTVFVFNGTYNEQLIINKSNINLFGENKETTIIEAGGNGIAIDIPADSNNNYIIGFTVRNTTYSAIYLHSDSSHTGATCNNNTISDCIIHDCIGFPFQAGIRILGNKFNCYSNNNAIMNCSIYNTSIGIALESTDNNSYVNNNEIIFCQIHDNDNGINFLGNGNIKNNLIIECNIFNNSNTGIFTEDVNYKNNIFHNNLINNNQNAFDDKSANYWYNEVLLEGNYYDDYSGEDDDGDGIGDTPYDIPGGSNQDAYPLVELWGKNPPIADFSYEFDDFTVEFNGSLSFDRDGEIVNYEWDFGDENNGTGINITHTYDESGEYDVELLVTDDDGYQSSIIKTIEVTGPNVSPEAPTIDGNNKGKPGEEYEFTIKSVDPNGDDVRYHIDWGDGTSGWTGYNASDEDVKVKHIWIEKGTYIITAKAQDTYGLNSSETTFEISMPKNKLINSYLYLLKYLFERFTNFIQILQYLF